MIMSVYILLCICFWCFRVAHTAIAGLIDTADDDSGGVYLGCYLRRLEQF